MREALRTWIIERPALARAFKVPYYYFYLALYHALPRKTLVSRFYRINTGRRLNLSDPARLNDKIQWLKLYWHDERAKHYTDKYAVRDIVRAKIGEEYLNPLYGVYDNLDQIDLATLPSAFVLKWNNGCGANVFCRNKSQLDLRQLRAGFAREGRYRLEVFNYEWCYEGIQPRIVCEKYIETKDGRPPIDYKFFCFHGTPRFLFVATDRGIDTKFTFFDLSWNRIPVVNHYKCETRPIAKPNKFEEMIRVATILAADFPFVRVDLYYENDAVIFGECTFFHFSGVEAFEPDEYDSLFGSYLRLSSIRPGRFEPEAAADEGLK